MGQIRPSLGKGSNATIPRHMGFSTPICRKVVYDPFCIFFPMMIFWKIKVNYVYLANFKLESGLRIRVTILDRRRRQRDKHLVNETIISMIPITRHNLVSVAVNIVQSKLNERFYHKVLSSIGTFSKVLTRPCLVLPYLRHSKWFS